MSEVTAKKGSFEWAMLNVKQGKRAMRSGWNGQGMFVLGNPGLADQTVEEDDFRNQAGVEAGTGFNYLPNLEIRTTEGDFVPWMASQMDMEAMDWALLCEEDERWMLVLDIEPEARVMTGADYSGYRQSLMQPEDVCGSREVIENHINATQVYMFALLTEPEGDGTRKTLQFGSCFEAESFEATKTLMNQKLTIKVDDDIFELGSATGLDDYFDTLIWRDYDISAHPALVEMLSEQTETRRYYFSWGE